jgi:hypothetical protein
MLDELIEALTPHPGKSCGSCTACCSTLAVKELNLPNWTRCPHVRSPPDAHTGCSIYSKRPPSCRIWICGWLSAEWEDEYRPDRCGVVVDPVPDLVWVGDEEVPVARLWILPGYEDAFMDDPARALVLAILSTGTSILWDMAPKDGQQLGRLIRRNAAGTIEISQPSVSTNDSGMSEAERGVRAMQRLSS